MLDVVLLYDHDCPNWHAAREALRQALTVAGLAQTWRELERGAPDVPKAWHGFGSPTILINGRDVVGERPDPSGGPCCRSYRDENSALTGAPSPSQIVHALRAARTDP